MENNMKELNMNELEMVNGGGFGDIIPFSRKIPLRICTGECF